MIEPDSINVTDLEITRPDRTGPGGDQAGTPTIVATALSAYYEVIASQVKKVDGSVVQATGLLMVDPPVDSAGAYVVISPGDLAAFTIHGSQSLKPREIIKVEPWYVGGEIDHLEVTF